MILDQAARRVGLSRWKRRALWAGLWRWLSDAQAWRFAGACAGLGFLFTLTSWGHPGESLGLERPSGELLLDIVLHVVGGMAALAPTRRPSLILAGGLGALAVDAGHVGTWLTMPVLGRADHALVFVVLLAAAMGALGASKGEGRGALMAAVGASVMFSHLGIDGMLGDGRFPLWAPLSFRIVTVPMWMGFVFQVAATALPWWAGRARGLRSPNDW